jgi:hypothetical protein
MKGGCNLFSRKECDSKQALHKLLEWLTAETKVLDLFPDAL